MRSANFSAVVDAARRRCPELSLSTTIAGSSELCVAIWPLDRRHGTTGTPNAIIVDAMRTTPDIASLIERDHQLFFLEVADGPGVATFDVTGFLWSSGLSVIAVDRLAAPVETGTLSVVLGLARHTPVRSSPDAAEPLSLQE